MTPRTSPFHTRLAPLCTPGLWKDWAGYVVAPQYQYSLTNEYYAVRNSVAVFDTTPLFKVHVTGSDASALLERALLRDIRTCSVGRAQYTVWCDEEGFVMQDGVIVHVDENEYWVTSAEPTLRTFRQIARDRGLSDVRVEDVSDDYGILAIQGPHAHDVLGQLTADAAGLRYFGASRSRIAGAPVVLSRTGYTGDLGYELWVERSDALRVWDALWDAGAAYNLTPMGNTALKMSRVEAGLLLMGADFHSSRFAWVDAQRETPLELGWSWMLRKLAEDDRDFIGRAAIEREIADRTSRWSTVGLAVDSHDYDRVYEAAGIVPPLHEVYSETTMSIYRRGTKEWDYAGYASSFFTSSLLKRPIALAKLPLDLTDVGTEVDLEVQVIRQPKNVLARVAALPFFNPARKTAPVREEAA
ncbi:MAG: aminomethyltransferase family protein [Gemmatimonadota bacterium]